MRRKGESESVFVKYRLAYLQSFRHAVKKVFPSVAKVQASLRVDGEQGDTRPGAALRGSRHRHSL